MVVWANHPPENLIILPLKNGPQKKKLGNHHYCLESMLLFEGVFSGSYTKTHLFVEIPFSDDVKSRQCRHGNPCKGRHLGISRDKVTTLEETVPTRRKSTTEAAVFRRDVKGCFFAPTRVLRW